MITWPCHSFFFFFLKRCLYSEVCCSKRKQRVCSKRLVMVGQKLIIVCVKGGSLNSISWPNYHWMEPGRLSGTTQMITLPVCSFTLHASRVLKRKKKKGIFFFVTRATNSSHSRNLPSHQASRFLFLRRCNCVARGQELYLKVPCLAEPTSVSVACRWTSQRWEKSIILAELI